jgi:hypothetical protein
MAAKNNGKFGTYFTMGLGFAAGAAVVSVVTGGVAYLATKLMDRAGVGGAATSMFGASNNGAPYIDTRRGQALPGGQQQTAANGVTNAQQYVS